MVTTPSVSTNYTATGSQAEQAAITYAQALQMPDEGEGENFIYYTPQTVLLLENQGVWIEGKGAEQRIAWKILLVVAADSGYTLQQFYDLSSDGAPDEETITVRVDANTGAVLDHEYTWPIPVFSADYGSTATPAMNPAGGTYSTPQSVTISCSTPNATIRYTTDGSDPSPSSQEYTGPISISITTTLKARAFSNSNRSSAVAEEQYTCSTASART